MRQSRRHFSVSQKAQIVRRHLNGKEPVSKLADDSVSSPARSTPGSSRCWTKPSVRWTVQLGGHLATSTAGQACRETPDQARQEERGHRRVDAGACAAKKRIWGALKGAWVPHDTRDEVVDYVKYWTDRTELAASQLLHWLGLGTSKFHDWKDRYGKVNEHNGTVPRDWWLEDWEKRAIVDYHDRHPLEGTVA